MNSTIEFRRRIGPSPVEIGFQCGGCCNCPDLFELADGDFAVIGADITELAASKLPGDSRCGPGERIIRLPRRLLINAKRSIPDSL